MLLAQRASFLSVVVAAACSTTPHPQAQVTEPDVTVADVTNPPSDRPADRADVIARPDAAPDAPADAAVDAVTDTVADAVSDAVTDTIADGVSDAPGDAPDLDAPGPWMPIPGAACNARERNVPIQLSPHVDPDAGAIEYITNPPASGPHFGSWTRWGAWPGVPRGHWVHNLEHGGVVYLYQCPMGRCESTRDALVAMTTGIPADPACMPTDAEPARVRAVITNDNVITTPIAAAAWGWLYAADCVDAPSLRSFYTRHAGMAPENFCFDGSYP